MYNSRLPHRPKLSYHSGCQTQTDWPVLVEPHSHPQLSGKAALEAAGQGWLPHQHHPVPRRWLCQGLEPDCSAPVSQYCSAGWTEMSVARTAPQADCSGCCWNLGPLALAAVPGTYSAVGSQWMLCCCQRSSGLGRTWALLGLAGGFQH